MTITRYVLVDSNGNEGDREYDTLNEAIEWAWAQHKVSAIAERTYVLADSSPVWTAR